ncbi:LysM peptidoglycan-binding domain-containing protein [Bradyrhizobium sp.]|jgi:nucleoid-associated protein YgaU|uniref:LysM peptidoglycan-binding domain-containing protein n=1 Tax=Bradyrhizobium sp. TaxID=376 RepID=UPI003C7E9A0B
MLNGDAHWSARLTDGYPFSGLDDRNKSAQGHPQGLASQRSIQGAHVMTAISIGRIVVPSLALVAVGGAALVFAITHVGREPPVETRAATAAPAVSPPASNARDEVSAALATAQAEAKAVAATPAVSPRAPDTDESVPDFDIARIEPNGDAVIAGRAAPGAIVELLRNGEPHDRAVADQSGQFVMVPPRLPPGDYELTLRSRQPDGKQVTSKQSVVVALAEVESSTGTVRSRAKMPLNVPETVEANRSVLDQAVVSSQPDQPSQPPLQKAKPQDIANSQQARATAATPLPDEGSPPTIVAPKIATTVVSPGDSLWRISRVTYGAGMRYALVYKANRDHIRNPNRIYPGQIFVLPMKAR